MENRQYMIFNMSEINLINFAEVLQSSENTLMKSVDGTKAFVKWEKPAANKEYQSQYEVDEDGMPYAVEINVIEEDYSSYVPSSIAALQTKEGPFTHSDMQSILSRPEWKEYNFNDRT